MVSKRDNGLAKTLAAMRRVKDAPRLALTEAMVKAANDLADAQRAVAPEDTGALKAAIIVTPPGGTTPRYSQPGGTRTLGPHEVAVTAGNEEVRYAHLVEHGSAPHDVSKGAASFKGRLRNALGGGTQHPGTEPQPFFWPVYRLMEKRLKSRIARAGRVAIKKSWEG